MLLEGMAVLALASILLRRDLLRWELVCRGPLLRFAEMVCSMLLEGMEVSVLVSTLLRRNLSSRKVVWRILVWVLVCLIEMMIVRSDICRRGRNWECVVCCYISGSRFTTLYCFNI